MIHPSRRSPWKNCASAMVTPELTTNERKSARSIALRCAPTSSPRNRRLMREKDIMTPSDSMEMSELVTPMASGNPPNISAATNAEASITVLLANSRRSFMNTGTPFLILQSAGEEAHVSIVG